MGSGGAAEDRERSSESLRWFGEPTQPLQAGGLQAAGQAQARQHGAVDGELAFPLLKRASFDGHPEQLDQQPGVPARALPQRLT